MCVTVSVLLSVCACFLPLKPWMIKTDNKRALHLWCTASSLTLTMRKSNMCSGWAARKTGNSRKADTHFNKHTRRHKAREERREEGKGELFSFNKDSFSWWSCPSYWRSFLKRALAHLSAGPLATPTSQSQQCACCSSKDLISPWRRWKTACMRMWLG